MRQLVYAVCEQQRRKSDQSHCFRCLDIIISLVVVSEIASLYLAYVAA